MVKTNGCRETQNPGHEGDSTLSNQKRKTPENVRTFSRRGKEKFQEVLKNVGNDQRFSFLYVLKIEGKYLEQKDVYGRRVDRSYPIKI